MTPSGQKKPAGGALGQRGVIRKILEHCGLWEEPRAPARAPPVEAQAALELRYEADPDYQPAPEEP